MNGVNANENYESGSSFQPSAEAIGEVKVGVADFSAEYGRDFTNLSATTKAGTNTFHGEVYEFFENDALNALVPINKAQGLDTKSAYRFNLYGGGLGGPVYIPKLLNLKDRAFFFVNYERNPHSLAGGNNLAIVPSDVGTGAETLEKSAQGRSMRVTSIRAECATQAVPTPGGPALQPVHWQPHPLQ